MKAVIQRVTHAAVHIEAEPSREIGRGLLILLGVARGDEFTDASWMARKVAAMRIFEDRDGKMNRSLKDIRGEALVVSQFTLLADNAKGNRPSFGSAALPEEAIPLYERFTEELSSHIGKAVPTGIFGARMQVEILNNGPVTITLDSRRTS